MALTIDYTRTPYRITLPLSDLTFIVGVQYNLEVDTFWDLLADYSDSELGIMYPPLYRRIPATTSTPSITEIDENYYDFEFEEGLYSVNVIDGNTNIRDVEVKNQVSVNTNNTTGFIDPKFLQFTTYESGVWVQADSGYTGTFYPVGTPSQPVNNIMDAIAIAIDKGFEIIHIKGTYTIVDTDVVDGFILQGISATKSGLIIPPDAIVRNCVFRECTLNGTLDGGNDASLCNIGDLNYLDGSLIDCSLSGTIILSGSQANFLRCYSAIAGGGFNETAIIDLDGFGTNLIIRDYHGGIKLINHSGAPDSVSIDMSSGRVILDSTIETGEYTIRGIGTVEDNSLNGATVYIQILDANILNRAAFVNEAVHLRNGSPDSGTTFPVGVPFKPVNNLVDAITIARRENLTKIEVIGFFVTSGTENLDGITLFGGSGSGNVLGLTAGTSTVSSGFSQLIMYGELGGLSRIENCVLGVQGLGGFTQCEGRIIDSIINSTNGIVQKSNGLGTLFDNCSFLTENNLQVPIDANGKSFSLRQTTGNILILNKTDTETSQLHLNGATVELDASCTNGSFIINGNSEVIDNSGGTVVVDNTVHGTQIQEILADTNELQLNQGSVDLTPVQTVVDAILIDTNELQLNQGDWATATGFSTFDSTINPVTTDTVSRNASKADVSALSTFDPTTDTITQLTDYTESALPKIRSILVDTSELQSNYFKPALDVVANVETVANTLDMRGTDNALIAANYVLPDNTSISSILTDTNELQLNQVDVNLTPLQVAVDFILQDTAAILVDTNELQSSQNAVDLVPLQTTVNAILQDTNELQLNQGIVDLSPIQNTLDAILIDTNQLQLNQGQWVTATGFVTNTTMTGLYNNLIAEHNSTQSAISGIVIPPSLDADGIHIALDSYANKDTFKADVSALPNDVNVISINGVVVTSIEEFRADTTGLLVDLAPVTNAIAALNDFNPVTDTVSRVALVDTTTANTDMRGTDNVIFDYTNIDDIHVSLNLDRNNPMSYTATQVSSADSSIIVNITENNTNDYTFTRA